MTFALSDDEVREAYILAADATNADRDNGEDYDAWLAAHDAEVRASVVPEEPEWEYAPAFEEDPALAVALINRDVAQREVDGWNQARRRTLAREGRDIGKSILVHRRKAGPWLPVEQEKP